MIFPCGCRERCSAPWPLHSDGALRRRSVPGSRRAPSFLFFFFPLPDDGRLATSRNSPLNGAVAGSRCQPVPNTRRAVTAYFWQHGKTGTRSSGNKLTAGKDRHPRRVRTRWQCGSQRRMTAGKDRHAWNGPWAWAPSEAVSKRGSNPPRSKGTAPRGATANDKAP